MLRKESILNVIKLALDGCSYERIQDETTVCQSSISRIKRIVRETGLTSEDAAKMDHQQFLEVFYPAIASRSDGKVLPDFEPIYKRYKRDKKRHSMLREWYDYSQNAEPGTTYGYTQFKEYFHEWIHENHAEDLVSMAVKRQPGYYGYLDWVGDKKPLVRGDKPDDPPRCAHFLVMTLGYSSMTWFAAYPDEKADKVAEGIAAALEFFGAVPFALRPDNMKTAVIKNNGKEIVLSQMMEDIKHHYRMEIHPCNPRSPEEKATVERAVQIIEKEFITPLMDRKKVFRSFEELNEKAAQYLEKLNGQRKSGETKSRKELYYQYDFPAMQPLPPHKFIFFQYTNRIVPSNYHIEFNGHHYCRYHQNRNTSITRTGAVATFRCHLLFCAFVAYEMLVPISRILEISNP